MFARFLVFLALAVPVCAQQTTATLLGTVSDASGASVPGVSVKAVNLATNVTRETLSDDGGAYSLPEPPAGQLPGHGDKGRFSGIAGGQRDVTSGTGRRGSI